MPQGFLIAIDGPVASGKGTTALALSNRLGGFFINTGGMYRAVALFCINKSVDINNEEEVTKVLSEANIEAGNGKIFLNGEDVTERIKESDTSEGSSVVAVYGSVRETMVKKQQEIGQRAINGGQMVIAEGRDVGTRVFPRAAFKVFLTASVEVRAKRRQFQYRAKGIRKEMQDLIEEIIARDQRDTGRTIDPLSSDPEKDGYLVLDNSDQTPEQTAEVIMQDLTERGLIDDKN
jgi:cytidylate kinase